MLSFWAACKEDPEHAANKLFVEAAPLWEQYHALPRNDATRLEARLVLLTEIDENMTSIVNEYPESSLAVELASTGKISSIAEAQAAARDLAGALTTAHRIDNAIWRAPALSSIAKAAAKLK